MTQPVGMEAHFGIFAWFGIPMPFPERMRLIREAGFCSTSLWWEEDHPLGRRFRYQAPEMARQAGLDLQSIHVPYRRCNALWDPDRVVRADAVVLHQRWVRDCARFECPLMVMHATLGHEPPPPTPAGIESIRRIVETAEACGVVVAVENTRSALHLTRMFNEISSPALGLCYDSSHDWLHTESPVQLLDQWGHRVVATHFADTDGILDRHWLPGEGIIDFGAIAAAVDWPNRPCAHSLESVPRDRAQDPETFLAEAKTAAHALEMRFWEILRPDLSQSVAQ